MAVVYIFSADQRWVAHIGEREGDAYGWEAWYAPVRIFVPPTPKKA